MKKLYTLSILFLILIINLRCDSSNSVNNNDYDIIPNATASEIEEWELTQSTMLGIRAIDPIDHHLNTTSQYPLYYNEGTTFSGAYRPTYTAILQDKQNVGGVLNRFHTADEGNKSNDINLWMVLFQEYYWIYNLFDQSQKNMWQRPGTLNAVDLTCINFSYDVPYLLGEIAVSDYFINDNEYFVRDDDASCANGVYLHKLDTFGMYGVVASDHRHGDQPEVHPAQQFWFRDKSETKEGQEAYWLIFFQDASDRFDDWAGSPLHGQFKIGFRTKPKQFITGSLQPLTMEIELVESVDVVTDEFEQMLEDDDPGLNHNLEYEGKTLVTVSESGYKDEEIGVKFVDLRKLSDGTIQGYVQLSLVIGNYNTDPLGRAIIKLVIKEPKSPKKIDVQKDLEVSPNKQ